MTRDVHDPVRHSLQKQEQAWRRHSQWNWRLQRFDYGWACAPADPIPQHFKKEL